jgi:hypothetical protein
MKSSVAALLFCIAASSAAYANSPHRVRYSRKAQPPVLRVVTYRVAHGLPMVTESDPRLRLEQIATIPDAKTVTLTPASATFEGKRSRLPRAFLRAKPVAPNGLTKSAELEMTEINKVIAAAVVGLHNGRLELFQDVQIARAIRAADDVLIPVTARDAGGSRRLTLELPHQTSFSLAEDSGDWVVAVGNERVPFGRLIQREYPITTSGIMMLEAWAEQGTPTAAAEARQRGE